MKKQTNTINKFKDDGRYVIEVENGKITKKIYLDDDAVYYAVLNDTETFTEMNGSSIWKSNENIINGDVDIGCLEFIFKEGKGIKNNQDLKDLDLEIENCKGLKIKKIFQF